MKPIHYYYLTALCMITGAAGTMHSASEYSQELPSMAMMHESAPSSAQEEESVYEQPSYAQSSEEHAPSLMFEEEVTPAYEPSVYEPVEEEFVYNPEQGEEEVDFSLFEEQ